MADDSPLPSSFDSNPEFFEEGRWRKLWRKLKEEPLIPLGASVTCWALYNAAKNLRSGGDPNVTNKYFRFRLYAQGFTIIAMVGGSFYYNKDRFLRAEYRRLKKKQEEQEKREKWIRELEVRDAEDREWRKRLGNIRDLEKREAEEMAMVAEKRRRDEAAALARGQEGGRNDDNRSVIEAIRLQNNAAKAKESPGNRAVEQEAGSLTHAVREATAIKKTQSQGSASGGKVEAEQEEPEKKEFRPILGESEQGGLFGIGHLKSLYAHITRDRNGQGSDSQSKRDENE